jgi:hypothetical protein
MQQSKLDVRTGPSIYMGGLLMRVGHEMVTAWVRGTGMNASPTSPCSAPSSDSARRSSTSTVMAKQTPPTSPSFASGLGSLCGRKCSSSIYIGGFFVRVEHGIAKPTGFGNGLVSRRRDECVTNYAAAHTFFGLSASIFNFNNDGQTRSKLA